MIPHPNVTAQNSALMRRVQMKVSTPVGDIARALWQWFGVGFSQRLGQLNFRESPTKAPLRGGLLIRLQG
jgi:hypothetical protein